MKRANQRRRKDDRKLSLNEDTHANKNIIVHPPTTIVDLRKLIKSLQDQLLEERRKRQKLQDHFLDYRLRTISREQQFFKMMEKYNPNRTSNIQDNSQIQEIYRRILKNFDAANQKTHQMLQEKYKKNCEFMERRVAQVILNMEEQLQKSKKLSSDSIKEIKNEIRQVLELAKSIEKDYSLSRQSIEELEFRNKVLKEQKKLLIEEILKKKKALIIKNETIKSQSHEKISKHNSNQAIQTNSRNVKFIGQPSLKDHHSPQMKPFVRLKNYRRNNFSRNASTIEEPLISKESTHANTIENLKNSLKREKTKTNQLGSIVTKLQNKNKDINEVLEDCLKNSEKEQRSMQLFLQSEKLFKTIKTLKRRLSMVESPIVSCGWDNSIDDLTLTTQ